MAEREDTLKHFCDVTGADEARSRFFLDSADWQLDLAISSFYESGGSADNPPSQNTTSRREEPIPVYSESDPEMVEETVSKPPAKAKDKGKGKKAGGNARFGTLEKLKQQQSSSDEEEGQAFYAGGSERSGQQILGPNKNRNDIVADMFRSAREHGAVLADEPPEERGGGRFHGTGYRLGATPDDHSVIAASNTDDSQSRTVNLRLWRDGFSVDDGELRPYANPENAAFLMSVRHGEIPAELRGGGSEVRISLEDRRHMEFPEKRKGKQQAFTGKGHLLGSPAPPTVGTTSLALVDQKDKLANQNAAQAALGLDEAQPVTSIQFRLADGTRLVGRFNHNHTVANLREYILAAMPAYQLQSFTLMTTFPNAELSNMDLTIDQAKLQNAVVVQKIT